jgi:hypothetical protein
VSEFDSSDIIISDHPVNSGRTDVKAFTELCGGNISIHIISTSKIVRYEKR